MNVLYFDSNIIKLCSQGYIYHLIISVGLGDGLVPIVLSQWIIYASSGIYYLYVYN